ncbi:uncharacterized protein BO66DRAFT_177866 [Aspergillus aculeatinus CBS 121060]|uniref:Uncharacterized protein n=3 Tax=Aspergillus TaxID=5052 RepID=A0A8G1VZW1_9EURO|nr:hypothetical protein BO95DRAFT_459737 [Aspergillus brunneoviolaceus CBS 621.78]XP_025507818.1 hypothetical protein BO66DRAFT_177866 [Aspergillus aculeatinus CBS 121060]XP_040803225.1 uncharacterized protein BO72DRAFT_457330 [Aspergillus fijiensis CBS 313.89]RAH49775.1 hypothetical protein BO95DRAFT_459737 [Aspergillus brunneoviolaceus CBS 621.78]RAH73995.1 hypothetical protein BO66DRAFT_177866 [Aspergillus aculeatinus CBS 121060]RAK79215.1 hypothetical protein BO72DRAFT_457330 [Aspergillus 
MECFRQLGRLIKAPFKREKPQPRVLEIGPPTNFRKEEMPSFFPDDDAATLHSRGSTLEKEKDIAIAAIERQQSTRDKIKTHVRRLSRTAAAAAPKPLAEQEE